MSLLSVSDILQRVPAATACRRNSTAHCCESITGPLPDRTAAALPESGR